MTFFGLIIKELLFEDVWFKPTKTKDKFRYQVYVYIIVELDLQSCGEFQADDLSLLEELRGFTLPGMAFYQLACSKHGSLCMRRRVVNHRVLVRSS